VRDEVLALDDIKHPSFLSVGKRVVSCGAPVAVFADQLAGNFNGFTGSMGSLHHAAAKQEPDAAFEQADFFVREVTVIRVAARV